MLNYWRGLSKTRCFLCRLSSGLEDPGSPLLPLHASARPPWNKSLGEPHRPRGGRSSGTAAAGVRGRWELFLFFPPPAASPAHASWTCQDSKGTFSAPDFFFFFLQGLETLLRTRWVENGYGRDSGCVRILEKALASDAMILLIIKSCASVISILKSSFGSGYFIRQFQKPASDRGRQKSQSLVSPCFSERAADLCAAFFFSFFNLKKEKKKFFF